MSLCCGVGRPPQHRRAHGDEGVGGVDDVRKGLRRKAVPVVTVLELMEKLLWGKLNRSGRLPGVIDLVYGCGQLWLQ